MVNLTIDGVHTRFPKGQNYGYVKAIGIDILHYVI